MRKRTILYSLSSLLILAASMLAGCSSSNGTANPDGSVAMNAISTTNPEGNIQATIGGVTINSPPVVTFALADENGQPINPVTMLKENSGNRLRFYIARLNDKGQYVNYISNASGSAPSYDGNANAAAIAERIKEIKPGVYSYTFEKDIKDSTGAFQHFSSASMLGKKPTTYDATKTHTVAIQILRNTNKNGKAFSQIANPYFNFRPDGQAVSSTREITPISACNKCHGKLGLHGGSRVDVALCILCHTTGVTTDGTKNTASIDMKVMVHKLHTGKKMATKSFFKTSAFKNFSTLTYPVFSNDTVANNTLMDCTKCHVAGTDSAGKSYGKDVSKYTVATIENCRTCHENRAFAGESTLTIDGVTGVAAVAHSGGVKADGTCSGCHKATATTEFDGGASVTGSHSVWEKSAANKGIVGKVLSVTNVAGGSSPVVTFQVTDKSGAGIAPNSANNSISILIGMKTTGQPDFTNALDEGLTPTDDTTYTYGFNKASAATQLAAVSAAVSRPAAITTIDAAKGIYSFNFANYSGKKVTGVTGNKKIPFVLPPMTNTTLAFTVQARRSDISISHRGVTSKPTSAATMTPGNYVYMKLDDGTQIIDPAEKRRSVFDDEKCNNCHNVLRVHGGSRPNGNSCMICHASTNLEANMPYFIHKIHTGEEINVKFTTASWPMEARYPNDRRRCSACHTSDNPDLPPSNAATTLLGATGIAAYGTTTIPATVAACTSCHDASTKISHAKGYYSGLTEQCSTCHTATFRKEGHQLPN